MSAPPPRIGPYAVVRELGRGGMGVVYEARDVTGRRVALKLILPGAANDVALTRFGREAELLARVRHPNVVQVHAVSHAPEGPYLVTEFVEGEPLTARARTLAPREAAALVRTLCDALAAVHAQGIVHRDLKPDNVIVRPDGSPVLLDFGVARGAGLERLTQTGVVVGTAYYMAPEQAEGLASRADARTDVYGLGAVLFFLLSGRRPFAETTSGMGLLRAVLDLEPRWPREDRPEVPRELEAICRRAMAKAPEDRFPTALALGAALDAALTRPAARRRHGLLVAVAVGLAALAQVLVAWVGGLVPAPAVTQGPSQPAELVRATSPPSPTRPAPAPSPPRPTEPPPPEPPPSPARAERLEPLAQLTPPTVLTVGWVSERLRPAVAWASNALVVGSNGKLGFVTQLSAAREAVPFDLPRGWGEPLLAPLLDGSVLCAGNQGVMRVRLGMTAVPELMPVDARTVSAVAGTPRAVVLGGREGGLTLLPLEGDFIDPVAVSCTGAVIDLAWSPDGLRLACATMGDDREGSRLSLFDATTLRPRAGASWPLLADVFAPGGFLAVAFAPDGTLLAGDALGRILRFDARGRPLEPLSGRGVAPRAIDIDGAPHPMAHPTSVLDIVTAADGTWAASLAGEPAVADGARELRVWDLRTQRQRRRVEVAAGAGGLALHVNDRAFAVVRPGKIDVYMGEELRRPEPAR